MALRLTGSLWQQVVGSGIIPYSAIALPTADSAKKANSGRIQPTRNIVAAFGTDVVACGVFGFHVLQDSFPIKSSENILITILSAQIKPLNMERLFSILVANR